MNEETSPAIFHRILVALDASPQSQAAVDAAVRLATLFGAEVEGLFIEDERLMKAAQLPFAEEVRAYTAAPKRLNDQRMERQLRYQAEYGQWLLRRAAGRMEVGHEFRVVEGDVTEELLEASADADLVVLGKTSTASSRKRLGTTCQAVLSEAAAPVLVLREPLPTQQPTLVYYDGSDSAEAALQVAVRLSEGEDPDPVDVLVPADGEIGANELRERIHKRYQASEVPLYLHPLPQAEIRRLSAFVRQNGGLVLLPADCPSLKHVPLQQLLYEMDRPLLVVR